MYYCVKKNKGGKKYEMKDKLGISNGSQWMTSFPFRMKANEWQAYSLVMKPINSKFVVMDGGKWMVRFLSLKETSVNDDVCHENKTRRLIWYNSWKLKNINNN